MIGWQTGGQTGNRQEIDKSVENITNLQEALPA